MPMLIKGQRYGLSKKLVVLLLMSSAFCGCNSAKQRGVTPSLNAVRRPALHSMGNQHVGFDSASVNYFSAQLANNAGSHAHEG